MKKLMSLLALSLSFNSPAQLVELNAVDAFQMIIKPGIYHGKNDLNENCHATIEKDGSDLIITVLTETSYASKTIYARDEYAFRINRNEFLQIERNYIDDQSYIEKVVRTLTAGNRKLYIVASEQSVYGHDSLSNQAECVINY